MVKMLPVPTIGQDLFTGYHVTWIEKNTTGELRHSVYLIDREKALTYFQTKYCQWLLEPLQRWCNQQEHLATVQMLTYAGRKETICVLCKLIRTFCQLPQIGKKQTAEMLYTKAIPLLEKAQPGTTSKYYAYSQELLTHYKKWVDAYALHAIGTEILLSEFQ